MPYTLSHSSLNLEASSYDISMISSCSSLILLCVLKDNLWRASLAKILMLLFLHSDG